jgi:hypothetical protein
MKHGALLTAALFLALGVGVAAAQEQAKAKTQTAIGPVKSVAGKILTVETDKGAMKFVVDEKTEVRRAGAGAEARARKLAGEPGLKITEVVHEGDQVFVRYTESGGNLLASEIEVRERRPASARPVK